MKWAQSEGYDWVALFDQDSTPPPAFIDTMLRAYDTSCRRDRIALLVPRYIDSRRGIPLSATYTDNGSLQVAMTSGSLMPISIVCQEGWFEDRLFIEVVDYEYCLRLRSSGYLVEECTGSCPAARPRKLYSVQVEWAALVLDIELQCRPTVLPW